MAKQDGVVKEFPPKRLTKAQKQKEVPIMGLATIAELSRDELEIALFYLLKEQNQVDKLVSKAVRMLEDACP